MQQQQPITVVDACPCWLAQSLNRHGELLHEAEQRLHDAKPQHKAVLQALKKAHTSLRDDYRQHVGEWREAYARNAMEIRKQSEIEPLQTSAWKAGDQAKLLQPKKKALKRTALQHHTEGAIAEASATPVVTAEPDTPKRSVKKSSQRSAVSEDV